MSRLALIFVGLALLTMVGPVWAGEKYDSFGAQSPKMIQSDDTIASQWDELIKALKVTLKSLLACEDQTNSVCRVESQWETEDIAASQTDQVLGASGAIGDLFNGIVCNTSAASVGVVSIKDGSGAAFTLFSAQAGATTQPLQLQTLGWVSTNGAWSITTGTNTTCRASGRFS